MFHRKTIKRALGQFIMASLLCLGFWQFGQGAYIPAKAWMAQELMHRAWLRAEGGSRKPAPWPWADTFPVARLSAMGGDVELIILEGGSGRTLAFGPGHLSISALPGRSGNSIIAGHRDTHFQFLQYMKVGEVIQVERPSGQRHIYEVTAIDVVDSRRGSLVLDTDESMLSLVTCYPFDATQPGGPMRYVVSARLVF
ncbi:MAG: class GN sortase [Woeseiaceae bacterium]